MSSIVSPHEPFILILSKPVTFAKIDYVELSLKEPTVGQVDEASKRATPMAISIALISAVASVPEGAIKLMGISDFNKAASYIQNFMPGGQATGGTSSPS